MEQSDERLPSTRWEYRRVKIATPPQAPGQRGAAAHNFVGLSPLDRREPVHLSIRYRGGAEAWHMVEARGRKVPIPGWMELYDLHRLIAGKA